MIGGDLVKEGLYYRDKRTDEILICHTFTRSSHVFINRNNVQIDRGKYNVYKVVSNITVIAEFETNRSAYPNRRFIREPHIFGWGKILQFNTIYENDSELCDYLNEYV
jgi:hypothetical protein